MTARQSSRLGVLAPLDVKKLLASVEAAPPIDAVEVVAAALTDALGARDVSFLIADYGGQALIRLSHVQRASADDEDVNRERGQSVAVAGTPHGRALTEQRIQIVPDSCGYRVFAPVTSRGEAVGVLALRSDDEPDHQTLATVSAGAHALAYIVIANRRFTDLFDWGQRSVPLTLEAELQHRLLPGSYTCEGGQFTLAGWLEPAGDVGVGGDTFDFSVDRDTLHLSMTDAMGHTLNAAVLATVLVGALRNARRRHVSLAEQTRLANEALCGFSDDGDFVTGQVVRIDHASGIARIVNAGHPLPILIRDGHVKDVDLAPGFPFGVAVDAEYPVHELDLQAGDRLVFLTDGILERNAAEMNAPELLTETRHLHPREAVRALIQAVVKACGGELRDDATVLCVDWHGGPTGERDASSGADR
jgi:serine phosphatase RsbU (regulator of sigma subunit)